MAQGLSAFVAAIDYEEMLSATPGDQASLGHESGPGVSVFNGHGWLSGVQFEQDRHATVGIRNPFFERGHPGLW